MARRAQRTTRLPWPATLAALFAIAFFALPLVGLIVRAPWTDAVDILTEPTVRTALRLRCGQPLDLATFRFDAPGEDIA